MELLNQVNDIVFRLKGVQPININTSYFRSPYIHSVFNIGDSMVAVFVIVDDEDGLLEDNTLVLEIDDNDGLSSEIFNTIEELENELRIQL